MNLDDFYPEERKFSKVEAMIYYLEHPDLSQRSYSIRWKWGLASVNRFINGTSNQKNGTLRETFNLLILKYLKHSDGTLFGTSIIYNKIYKEIEGNLHPLQIAIQENLSNVSKMEQQLTEKQCDNLIKEYSKETIWQYLQKMDNYKPLRKKSLSVNSTVRNWMNRDKIKKRNEIIV